jgi:hypothetical protein
MSIWGANFTENDDAADWLVDYLEHPSLGLLKDAFNAVLDLDDETYIEITDGANALIAAQIFSEILSDTDSKILTDNLEDFKKLKIALHKKSEKALNELIMKAILCTEAVASEHQHSELYDLMREDPTMLDRWQINLYTLISSLAKKLNPSLSKMLENTLNEDKLTVQNDYDFTVINLKKITCSEVLPRYDSGFKWMDFSGFDIQANVHLSGDEDRQHDIWVSVKDEFKFIFTNQDGIVIIEVPKKSEDGTYFRYDIDDQFKKDIEPLIQEVWHQMLSKHNKILLMEKTKHDFTVDNFLRITRSFVIPNGKESIIEKYWIKVDSETVYIMKKGSEEFYKNKNEAITIVGELFIRVTIDKNYQNLKIAFAKGFTVDDKHVNDHNGTLTELDLVNGPPQLVNKFKKIWKGIVDAVLAHERYYEPSSSQEVDSDQANNSLEGVSKDGIYKLKMDSAFELERSPVFESIDAQSVYKYSDSYAKFLKTQNGFNSHAAANGYTSKIQEYLTPSSDGTTLEDLNQDFMALYGYTTNEDYSLVEENKNFIFKNYLFNIGNDQAGNNFVEVLHGKYVGYIGSIDHDMYLGKYSLVDFVEEFDLEGFFEVDLATATEMLCDDFLMTFHAVNMDDFINKSMYYVDDRGIYFKYLDDKSTDANEE